MWKLMVSCVPVISRCWCIRNPWRLKGDTCPLWAGGSGQGQCEASVPEAPFSRSGCTDCPAVDHEWHVVEGSVSREGMKGIVQLKKNAPCLILNLRKNTLCNCGTTPQQWSHLVLLAFQARDYKQTKQQETEGEKNPTPFSRVILAEKKQHNKTGTPLFSLQLNTRPVREKKPVPFLLPKEPQAHLSSQMAAPVPDFAINSSLATVGFWRSSLASFILGALLC